MREALYFCLFLVGGIYLAVMIGQAETTAAKFIVISVAVISFLAACAVLVKSKKQG